VFKTISEMACSLKANVVAMGVRCDSEEFVIISFSSGMCVTMCTCHLIALMDLARSGEP
jgi:hypothetical protein